MSFPCNFCDYNFTQKKGVIKHINENRCKSEIITNLVKINELSAQIAREEDRRYEVYATVIASNRIAGLEGISYADLNDAMKSPSLLVRLGLFGIYEDRGQLYEESAIGATEDATPAVSTPAPAPKTQDEVVKP